MKPRAQIILISAVLLGVAALSSIKRGADASSAGRNRGACCPLMAALDARRMSSATTGMTTDSPTQQVIAYYFHGTVRCESCLKIEEQARETIERQFKAELDAKRLVFKPANYERPENTHFLQDYKLPCPSLVLVRQKDGKDEKWTLLGDTWQLVHDPVKFNSYIETEMNKYLRGEFGRANSNGSSVPWPTSDHR